jgi:PAS domain S-box-containing protein
VAVPQQDGDWPERTSRHAGSVRVAVLEAFVDTAGDSMFSIDADNRVSIWNHAATRLFGYDATDVVGTEWTQLFPEHRRNSLMVVVDAVASGDRVDRFETEIERREGMAVPVSLSVRGVFDRGAHLGSVAVIRDITEQRLAQAMLAEAEARLREGEALTHVGRWQWDVATNAVQWSDEYHRIHGVDPLDFDGTFDAHVACIHEDDRARVRAAVERSIATGRAAQDEYRIVRPDGEIRSVQTRAEPTIDSAGAVVGLRGVGQDITEKPAAR